VWPCLHARQVRARRDGIPPVLSSRPRCPRRHANMGFPFLGLRAPPGGEGLLRRERWTAAAAGQRVLLARRRRRGHGRPRRPRGRRRAPYLHLAPATTRIQACRGGAAGVGRRARWHGDCCESNTSTHRKTPRDRGTRTLRSHPGAGGEPRAGLPAARGCGARRRGVPGGRRARVHRPCGARGRGLRLARGVIPRERLLVRTVAMHSHSSAAGGVTASPPPGQGPKARCSCGRRRRRPGRSRSGSLANSCPGAFLRALGISASSASGVLAVAMRRASPFAKARAAPAEGATSNALLQDPGIAAPPAPDLRRLFRTRGRSSRWRWARFSAAGSTPRGRGAVATLGARCLERPHGGDLGRLSLRCTGNPAGADVVVGPRPERTLMPWVAGHGAPALSRRRGEARPLPPLGPCFSPVPRVRAVAAGDLSLRGSATPSSVARLRVRPAKAVAPSSRSSRTVTVVASAGARREAPRHRRRRGQWK